jgi:hypothetical protein
MHSYGMKVYDRTYLWGSPGIQMRPAVPLLLTLQLDEFGDAVDLSWETLGAAPPLQAIGRLMPGQVLTLNLRDAYSVIAQPVHGGSCRISCVLATERPAGP